MATSPYRLRARELIEARLALLPEDADEKAARKSLRGMWPPTPSHPYQMFLKEVKLALTRRYARVFRLKGHALPLRVIALPDGVLCDWCQAEGCIACSEIRREREAFLASDQRRLGEWWDWMVKLKHFTGDALSRRVFADWLEDNGWPEQGGREREVGRTMEEHP